VAVVRWVLFQPPVRSVRSPLVGRWPIGCFRLQRDDRLGGVCQCGVRERVRRVRLRQVLHVHRPTARRTRVRVDGGLAGREGSCPRDTPASWVHWKKIRTYEDPNAWARRVLRNLAAKHARHMRRAPRPIPPENAPELDADRVAVLQALGHLPRPQREALVLHDGLGFSVAEVATELNVPEGTVRSWLSRARAVLAPLVSAGDDSTEVIR
jgi:sigma-70-like protein